jgi:hypothetical protein
VPGVGSRLGELRRWPGDGRARRPAWVAEGEARWRSRKETQCLFHFHFSFLLFNWADKGAHVHVSRWALYSGQQVYFSFDSSTLTGRSYPLDLVSIRV